MDARVENPVDESLGDVVQRLIDDGRALASAEARLYREIALYRAGKAKTGLIALAVGGVLALAGLIAALVGLVLGLAVLVGPIAGGLIVLAICGAAAYLLARFGAAKMRALSGDEEEKAALLAGERNP